ncbi:unnamed protein product [Notodromas monacha]|uniref:Ribonuclease H1 n=1 Tax=Notodromas monacha TaxID=399045 RepID=A0A7R9BQF3_9CRUS|nr:unnamed protein product [Notodromas monacha]CAG0919549.1 unnamed protein product [Notodromas monacha]
MPFYAVVRGYNPGIYYSWAECEPQVSGFSGADYRKFPALECAEAYCRDPEAFWRLGLPIRRRSRRPYRRYPFPGAHLQPAIPLRILVQARLAEDDDFHFTEDGFAICYTDGSCMGRLRNAGVGVWFGNDHVANICEPLPIPGTNNKAELLAVLYAIHAARESGLDMLEVRTDSRYAIYSLTEWLPKWKSNNWLTTENTDVQNQGEIRAIDEVRNYMEVRFEWTPGHAGNSGNSAADSLAKRGAARALTVYRQ